MIEVTQEMAVLESGTIKHNFLQAGSFAYYEYTPKIDTEVIYEISDNNKMCVNLYVSDDPMPGPLNALKTALHNKINLNSTANTLYYIGVEAIADCAYSIVATDASNEIVRLEKGTFGNLNLNVGEVKYFLIKNDAE